MFSSIRKGRQAVASARWLALLGGLTVSVSACQDAVAPTSQAAAPVSQSVPQPVFTRMVSQPIPDEYIVVLKSSVSDVPGKAKGLLKKGSLNQAYGKALHGFSAHMTKAEALSIASDPSVAYVEQDQRVQASGTTQINATWGIDRIDQASLPLNEQYTYSETGAGVNVYIIDTGIRRTHTQFGGRVVPAFTSIADSYGPDGCHWHGSHVAGTVGGSTVGVAKSVKLYSVRVLDCAGSGTVSGVIAGIDWVTANRVLPAVANMSIDGSFSQAENDAIQRAIDAGVTFVVAAGNSSQDACGSSPASATNAITVGATMNNDAMAAYSNSGGCVDLFAPGSSVYSASNTDDNAMQSASGTSMASPHVAGAAALYLQANPSASPAQVASAITSGATAGILTGLGSGSANLLLRVNGSGSAPPPQAPPPPPPPPPPATNTPPTASFSVSCSKANCSFDGSSSKDNTSIVSYQWSFGDGGTAISASSPYTTHNYSGKGNYSMVATLTVSDASGLKSSVQKTVNIKNNGK